MDKKETRMEVVDKIALSKAIARRTGLTIVDAMEIIDILQAEVIEAVKNNKKIQLNGFLTITPKDIEGKTIISPLDKREYVIPAKRTVEIKAGKHFKDSIKDAFEGTKEEKDAGTKKRGRPKK